VGTWFEAAASDSRMMTSGLVYTLLYELLSRADV